MPRYFFNIRHRPGPAGLAQDREGEELADVAAARAWALADARVSVVRDRLTLIRDWMDCTFEITDTDGVLVLTVPFGDIVPKADLV